MPRPRIRFSHPKPFVAVRLFSVLSEACYKIVVRPHDFASSASGWSGCMVFTLGKNPGSNPGVEIVRTMLQKCRVPSSASSWSGCMVVTHKIRVRIPAWKIFMVSTHIVLTLLNAVLRPKCNGDTLGGFAFIHMPHDAPKDLFALQVVF